MEPIVRDDPRAANDSRKLPSSSSGNKKPVKRKPNMRQRFGEASLSKMATFWLCLGSVVLVLVLGFTLGGWKTAGGAEKLAETMAKDAVIERLTPICVAHFNQDPNNILKLDELNAMSSYQQAAYVQDQGWATFSGDEKPDRLVASACTKLILEMNP